MVSTAEAERLILEAVRPWPTEDCPLDQAHGRVLRQGIRADRDLPPFDRATLDGYALRAGALAAGGRVFRVTAVQAAGARPLTLGPAPGACIEIMTGAALPAGADCVIPYENVDREGDEVRIGTGFDCGPGHAVHAQGGDHRAGAVIVPAGTRLTGREIAVAAACGCAQLAVARSPRIAIVATGDELVEVDGPAAPYQVRRSNDYALRAALAAAGYPRTERFLLRDVRPEIEHLLWHLLAEYDVVVLTGGVSKGRFDHIPEELARQGVTRRLHGVAQRPGKPLWFGMSRREAPVFALPGNPVSAYTCLHRYVLPAMDHASGLPPAPARQVALAAPVRGLGELARLLPVRVAHGPLGEAVATPAPGNTSGDFAGLVGTDGFVELPSSREEFSAGYCALFHPWF